MKYLTDKIAIRHGDIGLLPIDVIPSEVQRKGQLEIHGGSHGHPHSIINGDFYPHRTGDNILGYLETKNGAYLTHMEHGNKTRVGSLKKTPIETGFYEVRVQVEDKHEGMKEVID